MRIEQLEYIAAVTRFGSLRRAAEALHVSQPALSETVRNLERELGVDLLDRRRSGARISAAGRELLPHIMGVLDAVDSLRRASDDQHRTTRMIRLGTVNAATVPLLVPTIQAFRSSHPETQIEVTGGQQVDIHRELAEGGLDLGLVNYLQGDDKPPVSRPPNCCVDAPWSACAPTAGSRRCARSPSTTCCGNRSS